MTDNNSCTLSEPELSLIILWSKCTLPRDLVKQQIEKQFGTVSHCTVEWPEDRFSENLTRFYGQNLPNTSHKVQHIGLGVFDVFLFQDSRPVYAPRKTSRGIETVNTRLFDLKTQLRSQDGGGHRVHGTINRFEGERDSWLLLGRSAEQVLAEVNGKQFKRNLVGSDGWGSLSEVLETLNRTLDSYVVLRNFEGFPESYRLDIHGDIDFLVSNVDEAAYMLNASRVFPQDYRVHYFLNINNQIVPIDLRYIDDHYHDPYWSRKILLERVLENGFYVPDTENYFYSLLYHALIHKPEVASDYEEKLANLAAASRIEGYSPNTRLELLKRYMSEKGYNFFRPKDHSVYFAWDRVERIDKATAFQKVLEQGYDHALVEKTTNDIELEFRALTIGALTTNLFDLSLQQGITAGRVALIAPQFTADFDHISRNSESVTVLCFCKKAHEIFQNSVQNLANIEVLFFQEKMSVEPFDLVIVPRTLELIPQVSWLPFVSFLNAYLSDTGVVQIAYDQTFSVDKFILVGEASERFRFEDIHGRPDRVDGLTLDPSDLTEHLGALGVGEVGRLGIYPECGDPLFFSERNPKNKIALADVIASSGMRYGSVSKLAVYAELEKQHALSDLFKGQLISLSRAGCVASPLLAKFSRRSKKSGTSTFTYVCDEEQGLVVKKKRLSSDHRLVTSLAVPVNDSLSFEVEHHTGSTDMLASGLKLSSQIELSELRNLSDVTQSAADIWCQYVLENCEITLSTGTCWEGLDDFLIDGKFLDIGPHNIIFDGIQATGFDFEWQARGHIPLSWYVVRNSMACYLNFSSVTQADKFQALAQKVHGAIAGAPLNTVLLENSMILEQCFQRAVFDEDAL